MYKKLNKIIEKCVTKKNKPIMNEKQLNCSNTRKSMLNSRIPWSFIPNPWSR
jgi:hypothetical protein